MEEDIKILKEWVEESKQFEKDYDLKKIAFGTLGQKRIMALENLINKNKELEKMVELMAKYIQVLISKYEDDTYIYKYYRLFQKESE